MARVWRNHTNIPDAVAKAIYEAVKPSGLSAHDVSIKNYGRHGGRGAAYYHGSAYHASARPFITVSIPRTEAKARVIRPARQGYMRIPTGSRLECLVLLLAHELRHLWQAKVKKGHRVWGARGQFSERDADAYALSMLRKFRRGELLEVR